MSTLPSLTTTELTAMRDLESRMGKREARHALTVLGLRTWLACGGVGLPISSPESTGTPVPRAKETTSHQDVEILAAALRPFGVDVSKYRRGRPTTVTLSTAKSGVLIGEIGYEVRLTRGVPATCAIAVAAKRTAAGPVFNLGRVAESDEEPSSTKPDVYAFVLLDERRVWIATRLALSMFRSALEEGKRVRMFGLGPCGGLRVRLPVKTTGLDVDQQILLEAP